MNKLQASFYQRVAQFNIDRGDEALTFTQRLARENDWSMDYAERVIVEYKRFAYLAVMAGHTVTPSDQIDQAWHLHLTYTRSYWEEFCSVLGQPLHHGPTRGGKQEADKFYELYEQTLQSYEQHFGELPPADIWPEAAIRFDPQARFIRLDKSKVWTLRKPQSLRAVLGVATIGLASVSCVVMGLTRFAFSGEQLTADGAGNQLTIASGWPVWFSDNWFVALFVIMIGVSIAGGIVSSLFQRRCGKCKQWNAMFKTGQTTSRGRMIEWKCRLCGQATWRNRKQQNSGWGSGCGTSCASDGCGSGCGSGCGGGCGGD